MKKIGLLIVATALMVSFAGAQGKMKGKDKAASKNACPVCKMELSAKKDKTHTVAVRLKKGGKVMYCCAGCKMPASVLVKQAPPKTHKMTSKGG